MAKGVFKINSVPVSLMKKEQLIMALYDASAEIARLKRLMEAERTRIAHQTHTGPLD